MPEGNRFTQEGNRFHSVPEEKLAQNTLGKSIYPGGKSIYLGGKSISCCPECDFGEDCCREIDLPSREIDFISQKGEKCLVHCMSWLGTYKTKAYKETKQYFWYLG